jgi:ArsR family transcriptional regulator
MSFVCANLTLAMKIAQPKVSHHLAALRKAGLVSDRKDGLWVHYRINEALRPWVIKVIRTAAQGISADEPFASDAVTMADLRNRADGICA